MHRHARLPWFCNLSFLDTFSRPTLGADPWIVCVGAGLAPSFAVYTLLRSPNFGLGLSFDYVLFETPRHRTIVKTWQLGYFKEGGDAYGVAVPQCCAPMKMEVPTSVTVTEGAAATSAATADLNGLD